MVTFYLLLTNFSILFHDFGIFFILTRVKSDFIKKSRFNPHNPVVPIVQVSTSLGKATLNKAKSISQSIDAQISNKFKHAKLEKIKNQCKKYSEANIYGDTTDILLGIGKVQVFAKLAAKNKLLKVEKDIYEIQLDLLGALKDKNRLADSYYNRVETLIKEQEE